MCTLTRPAGIAVAVCYELTVGDSPDLQDIEVQADFLRRHISGGHSVSSAPFGADIAAFIASLKHIDVAWNLFELFNGKEENQHLGAALLEMAGVRYTGSKLSALVLCSDKRIAKALLAGEDIAVPQLYRGIAPLNSQWIVKPSKLHGSVGITDNSVMDGSKVRAAISAEPALGLIAEEYIEGGEYSAALLDMGKGLKTIAVAQMQFIDYPKGKPQILNYDSKWSEDSADYAHSVRTFNVDKAITAKIAQIAERTARILGLGGFVRIDFRMNSMGKLYVIDVNPNPGLGDDSGFIAACAHAGISAEDSLNFIIDAALR